MSCLRVLAVLAAAAIVLSASDALAADDDGKQVEVVTKDRVKLAGTIWSASQPGGAGVVLLHMVKSDRGAWAPLVPHLRARGLTVLTIDLRGHGANVKKGFDPLAQRVEKRDPKLFADMHQDAIAAVRFLVKEGRCDPKRIALVGASVGASIALDAARRYPSEASAVCCMSPGANYLGLDSLEHAKTWPAETPLLLLVHRIESEQGAVALHEALPKSRVVVYEDATPADASKDGASWAHGTRMFGRIPLVEQTVASFVAARTGSKTDDVVLDGSLDGEDGPDGAWTRATKLEGEALRGWAYRVGRRVQFGGRVTGAHAGVSVALTTHFVPGTAPMVAITRDGEDPGNPEVAAIDLAKGTFAWVEPYDSAHGKKSYGARTRPVVRVVKTPDGFTFEGEWYSDYGEDRNGAHVDPKSVGLALGAEGSIPERPREIAPGALAIPLSDTTDVQAR